MFTYQGSTPKQFSGNAKAIEAELAAFINSHREMFDLITRLVEAKFGDIYGSIDNAYR